MRRSNPSSNVSESGGHHQYNPELMKIEERRTLFCLWDLVQITTIHADIGACNLKGPLDKLSLPVTCEQV